MLIFKKITERFYYYIDSFKAANLKAKIESFKLNHSGNNIIVTYRLGRQKLLNRMNLSEFENEYFDKVSHYDQHRLTKFSTLQFLLQDLFCNNLCEKDQLISFIEDQARNEQLL